MSMVFHLLFAKNIEKIILKNTLGVLAVSSRMSFTFIWTFSLQNMIRPTWSLNPSFRSHFLDHKRPTQAPSRVKDLSYLRKGGLLVGLAGSFCTTV